MYFYITTTDKKQTNRRRNNQNLDPLLKSHIILWKDFCKLQLFLQISTSKNQLD